MLRTEEEKKNKISDAMIFSVGGRQVLPVTLSLMHLPSLQAVLAARDAERWDL